MIKKVIILGLSTILLAESSPAQAIDIIAVIKAGVTKVIRATDLEVQRMQTETIELQNAEQEIVNIMTRLKLQEISDWAQKQENLFREYYTELWQVKSVIAGYDKLKNIIALQAKIVSEYQASYALFRQDRNFSAPELSWMYSVYSGILNESLKNVQEVMLVASAFVTQMSDAERLATIDKAARAMQKNYNDLKAFNAQNIQLSLQRAAENNDIGSVKQLYGL